MLVMVTFISMLVAIYSIGYMHGDRGYWRFFTYISLFVFSMCMLVTVSKRCRQVISPTVSRMPRGHMIIRTAPKAAPAQPERIMQLPPSIAVQSW